MPARFSSSSIASSSSVKLANIFPISFKTLVSTSSAVATFCSPPTTLLLLIPVDIEVEVGDCEDFNALIFDVFPAIVVVTDAEDDVDFELAPEHEELELEEDRDVSDVSWRLTIARCLIVPALSLANGMASMESMLEFDCGIIGNLISKFISLKIKRVYIYIGCSTEALSFPLTLESLIFSACTSTVV